MKAYRVIGNVPVETGNPNRWDERSEEGNPEARHWLIRSKDSGKPKNTISRSEQRNKRQMISRLKQEKRRKNERKGADADKRQYVHHIQAWADDA